MYQHLLSFCMVYHLLLFFTLLSILVTISPGLTPVTCVTALDAVLRGNVAILPINLIAPLIIPLFFDFFIL